MRKIKYLFLSLLLIPLLTGCDFFDRIFGKDDEIEITYVFKDKQLVRTYKSYEDVTFEAYNTTTGYEFKGWSFDVNGKVITKSDLKGKSKVNLFPIIDLTKYSITYNLDGGTNNPSNPTYYTIESEITLSAPSKEGFAFVGWTTDTITEPVLNYKIEVGSYGNITLTANYIPGMINVTFYGYEDLNQIVEFNTLCTKPADPVKLGDTFDYWATDDSLETPFNFDEPVTKNITLYPKWMHTTFYTLTIDNCDLIETNYSTGKSLPEGAVINLKTDYIIEGYEFMGWYVDGDLYTKNYKISLEMPNKNMTITPMFNSITTYEYTIGSNTNLFTGIMQQSDGRLYGCNITDYNNGSTGLFISYYALDKLKPGLNSFVYENRIIIHVFIKVKDKDITNINVDYDINYPLATLTFNEVEGYSYSYSLDGENYTTCHSGDTFIVSDKMSSYLIKMKCDDGLPIDYSVDALPLAASEYITKTFTYQGNTYDHYIDSDEDLKTIIEYYACAAYPAAGGTELSFKFYHPVGGDLSDKYSKIVKRELSVPYGLHYSYTTSGKEIRFVLSSSGMFNSLATSQERHDLTNTVFAESTRSETFNDFYIEKCSKTQEVRSIYELENLDFGIRPIIHDSNVLLLYNKAKEILRNYVDDSMSDFEKLKAIYDYLASYVTYDDALLEIMEDRSDYRSFTAYSALIYGIAVCDGISSAFKLLCNIEGIECIEVIGSASTGGHAWNKVKVGNAWYGIDATWSRTTLGADGEYVYHQYFMINEADLITIGNGHYEQADINGEYISYHNVDITANNSLNYYDLMMYGKYDLVVSSYAEALEMKTYFTLNNIRYVELYLDGISKSQAEAVFSSYSCYSSSSDSHRLFLLK